MEDLGLEAEDSHLGSLLVKAMVLALVSLFFSMPPLSPLGVGMFTSSHYT